MVGLFAVAAPGAPHRQVTDERAPTATPLVDKDAPFVRARQAAGIAATIVGTGWKGTINNGVANTANWSDAANWNGTPPGADERNLYFGLAYKSAAGANFIANNDLLNYIGHRITFENVTDAASFTLTGNAITLADFSGAPARIENNSLVNQTINFAGIHFAGSAEWAEIRAVSGPLTFGSSSAITFGGSVAGLKLFSTGQTITFNNDINASGRWLATTGTSSLFGNAVHINADATLGDIYVMNGARLVVNLGASLRATAVRLGGDLGVTGEQDQSKSGSLVLGSAFGGQTFSSPIYTVAGNTGTLSIYSGNSIGTNSVASRITLESDLSISQNYGGASLYEGGSFDIRDRKLTAGGQGGLIIISQPVTSSLGTGGTFVVTSGQVILQHTNNTYTGTDPAALNPNGTQIRGGWLGIYGDGSLGLVPATAYNNIQVGTFGHLDIFADVSLHQNRNLLLGGTLDIDTRGFDLTINGVINGVVFGGAGIRAAGPGTLRLLNPANSYTGYINAGNLTLEVTKLANGGSNSSVGASSSDPTNLTISGTLRYIGSGDSTNRNFRTGGAFFLDSSGTGALNFTNTSNLLIYGNTTLTLTGSNSEANTFRLGISNGFSEFGPPLTSVVKDGTGSWVISGNNTYTGTTTVNGGTLTVQNGSGAIGKLAGTSAVSIRTGATLALAGDAAVSDRVNNNAHVVLTNGKLRLEGVAEGTTALAGLGTLSLVSNNNSILDLAGTALLHFAASGHLAWSGTLSIWNWSGSPLDGALDQLLFGTDDSSFSLSPSQLHAIRFYSDSGATFIGSARFAGLNNGAILPVPEPATWVTLSAGLVALALACRLRRKATAERLDGPPRPLA